MPDTRPYIEIATDRLIRRVGWMIAGSTLLILAAMAGVAVLLLR